VVVADPSGRAAFMLEIRAAESRSPCLSASFLLPIGTLVTLALVISGLFVWYSVSEQDRQSRDASVAAISEYLKSRSRAISRITKDYAWWNDAVRYLQLEFNSEWADKNLGYVYSTHGFEVSMVLDRKGHTIYAAVDGERVEAEAMSLIGHGLPQLINRALAASNKGPQPASGLIDVGGQVAIAAVCALTPEDDAVEASRGERNLLLVAKRLDASYLDDAMPILRVADLKIVAPKAARAETAAAVPLLAADGHHLADLVWKPARPGSATLLNMLPVLGLALAALVLGAYRILVYTKRASDALQASETRFRDVANTTSDWIWETDAEFRCTFLSTRFSEATGIPVAEVLGRRLQDVLSTHDGYDFAALAATDASARGARIVLCTYVDGVGRHRTLRLAGAPVRDKAGRHVGNRGTASDITAEVEAQSRVSFLALHDSLTELPNRVLLTDRLHRAIQDIALGGGFAAVLYIDLDRFKEINDSLGHDVGDRLLRAVSERLRANVRKSDTVARLGGDEFVVLHVGLEHPTDAQNLCRRLLHDFQRPFQLDEQQLIVTISIGVALVPKDGDSLNMILRNADVALLQAKASGRNTLCFYESKIEDRLMLRKNLERELQDAVRTREFSLLYQPRIDLTQFSMDGAEALVRWEHRERGILLPAHFIPAAEETGLITPLGDWILTRACAWASARSRITVAVNISPIQFRSVQFVASVHRILERTSLSPDRLELEVTENVLLENTDQSLATLRELRRLGVCLSLDDFGTGYASLSYLLRFEFDKIKIDRSFVQRLGMQAHAESIIRSILTLAHNLGMRVCAEGVETAAQLEFLRDERCDEAQGFLFSQPLAPHELDDLTRQPPWHVPADPSIRPHETVGMLM
jgi:diguanylate cyclase (GGDEF)-like protein/PAS domain S-box-containing protein